METLTACSFRRRHFILLFTSSILCMLYIAAKQGAYFLQLAVSLYFIFLALRSTDRILGAGPCNRCWQAF